MFNYKYLAGAQLKGLKQYQYTSIDSSPFSNYVMHPIWNTLIKIIPKWIAPNTITMLGFCFLLTKVILLMVYDYEYYAAVGATDENIKDDKINFIYVYSGIFLFLYYNLDGLDGKQARRTGITGPLGELFDHGLDSFAVFLISFSCLSVFGRDEFSASTFRLYLSVLDVVLNSYLAHCNQYMTGVLYLPWGYDIGMWTTTLLFLISGIKGPAFFKVYFGNWSCYNILEVVIFSFGVLTTSISIGYNILQKNFKRKYTVWEAVRSLNSMAVMMTVMTSWALLSPSNILDRYPRPFLLLFGVLFSQITTRLIVSCMCNSRCEAMCWMLWPVLAGVVLSLWLPSLESAVLHALLLFTLTAHVHYGVCVVRQLCRHLNISCFSVTKRCS